MLEVIEGLALLCAIEIYPFRSIR